MTFLKIGEINTLKEQFDADILLRCKWREPELDREPSKAEVNPSIVKYTNMSEQGTNSLFVVLNRCKE